MRSFIALLALAAICDARPSFDAIARPSFTFDFDSFVVNGEEATPGEFPWQLSQQRLGTTWSHSCGASLLSSRYALSASHCVDGAAVGILRVIAGLHDRTAISTGVISNLASYKMHESYNQGTGTFANDIAILTLATEIAANGGSIQYASLPDDNNDQFVGRTCVISGWGRTDNTNILPTYLQKASIQLLSLDECNARLSPVNGAVATDGVVCLYDSRNITGSCNGDSGGPLNCNYPTANDARLVVFGVTSWGISSLGRCRQDYPSVYTRTAYYLRWIGDNTP